MASAQRILSCMDRALAQCPRWTWHHDTSVRLWYFTLLSPLAWGWPSPTLRRLTALTHFPSECQKSLGSNLSLIICVLFPFPLEVWQGSSLLMSWWFAWSWPAQIAAIYELFPGFWFWLKQTELCRDVDCWLRLYWASCFDTKWESVFLFFKFDYNNFHCILAVTAVWWRSEGVWLHSVGGVIQCQCSRTHGRIQLQSKPPLFSHKCCVVGWQLFSLLTYTHIHVYTTCTTLEHITCQDTVPKCF